jgi:predicted transcriptional regulator
MDARDLQQIDAFLADQGQASLLEYYGVTADTPADEVRSRIKTKRSWAQAQQANPKFRYQALWLIKNNSLVQRVLIEEMKAYVEAVAARERDRKLQMLDLFVQGSLVSGKLSSEAEAAIRRQASEMGLTDAETSRYLEEKVGPGSQEELFDEQESSAEPGDGFVDYYALLEISPQATAEEIEEAYRERYRWARTLKDLQRANDIYRELEQAWRILSDMTRRRDYDDQRRKRDRLASAPKGAPQVPDALRPTPSRASAPPSPAPDEISSSDVEQGEPPSQLQLGRPGWAEESAKPKDLEFEAPRPMPPPSVDPEPTGPTPPPSVRSRTFQPGTPEAPARPRHSPRLSVEGPDQISLGLLFKPVVRTIKVHNAGRGRLRGNVASSQPWLQVSPRTLHLKGEPQYIELRAFPRRLPGRSGRARVTISTTHGERWAINVDAHKRRVSGIVLGLLTIVLLLVAVLERKGLTDFIPDKNADGVRTVLQLSVDPPQASILLNDKAAGRGPEKLLMDPTSPGVPLELKVELQGREPYIEELIFVDRQRIRRSVTLASSGLGPSYAVDQDGRRIVSSFGQPETPEEPAPEPEPAPEEPAPEPEPAAPPEATP